jgi:hypothetical protein
MKTDWKDHVPERPDTEPEVIETQDEQDEFDEREEN